MPYDIVLSVYDLYRETDIFAIECLDQVKTRIYGVFSYLKNMCLGCALKVLLQGWYPAWSGPQAYTCLPVSICSHTQELTPYELLNMSIISLKFYQLTISFLVPQFCTLEGS